MTCMVPPSGCVARRVLGGLDQRSSGVSKPDMCMLSLPMPDHPFADGWQAVPGRPGRVPRAPGISSCQMMSLGQGTG